MEKNITLFAGWYASTVDAIDRKIASVVKKVSQALAGAKVAAGISAILGAIIGAALGALSGHWAGVLILAVIGAVLGPVSAAVRRSSEIKEIAAQEAAAATRQQIIQRHFDAIHVTDGDVYHGGIGARKGIEWEVKNCIHEIAGSEGIYSWRPGHVFGPLWDSLKQSLSPRFQARADELLEAALLKERQEQEAELARLAEIATQAQSLAAKHAPLIDKFHEVAEGKVSQRNKYGEECWNTLDGEIKTVVSKIGNREEIPALHPVMQALPKLLEQLFREYHEQKRVQPMQEVKPAEAAAEILGIEYDDRAVEFVNLTMRFKGFYSFVGTYEFKLGCAQDIRAEFPTNTALHAIADDLCALFERRKLAGKSSIKAKVSQRGNCRHDAIMQLEYAVAGENEEVSAHEKGTLFGAMSSFAEWVLREEKCATCARCSDVQSAQGR